MVRSNFSSTKFSPIQTLAYVSPKFPALSLVFEQNQLDGIVKAGVKLELLSCRKPDQKTAAPHRIVQELLASSRLDVHYFSMSELVLGWIDAITERPTALLAITGRTVSAIRSRPRRFGKYVAAWALAVANWNKLRDAGWIHSDFGQGTATVAWHLAELLDKPFSFTLHAFDIYSEKPALRDPPEIFAEKCRAASVIFCAHGYGKSLLAETLPAELLDKVMILPVSVQVSGQASAPGATPTVPAGSTRIVALGRLIAEKGFTCLLDALSVLRAKGLPFHCDLYGSGELERVLREKLNSLGLDGAVTLHGAYRNEDLGAILADRPVVAVPSLYAGGGRRDGMPTVILEAFSHGCPVVASAVSAIPEVVHHGRNGMLVPPGDSLALAATLQTVIRDRELRQTLGSGALQYVRQNHDHCGLARQFLDQLHTTSASG